MRQLFRLNKLTVQRRIGGAPAHGEVIGLNDNRPSFDPRAAEQDIGGQKACQIALGIILANAAQFADLAE